MRILLLLLMLAPEREPSIVVVKYERVEFVGADGKLRRTVPVRNAGDVKRVLRMHEEGRETFKVGCVRCHGEDGDLDTYLGIKKLGGIGSRLTLEQIKSRLHPMPLGNSEVTVRGHVVSRERLDSLVAYVASL